MTWTQWVAKLLFRASDAKDEPAEIPDITGQTQRFTRTLFFIALVGLVALMISTGPLEGEIRFVVWALVGALASAVVGAALGLLFGLPTVEAKREALATTEAVAGPNIPIAAVSTTTLSPPTLEKNGSASPQEPPAVAIRQAEEVELGYRDSTSLEQIADWLTKIIVGLTLTQYASWEDRFQILASNLTAAMIGAPHRDPLCIRVVGGLSGDDLVRALDLPVCRASAIPGGVIIVLFATAGFLICYLWMRRYFILEMVTARSEAYTNLRAANFKTFELAKQQLDLDRDFQRQQADIQRRQAERKVETEIKVAEEEKLIRAARELDLAESSPARSPIDYSQLDEILARAESRVAPASAAWKKLNDIHAKLNPAETDPDDPWRGKFGQQSCNGVQLEATVSSIGDSQQFFKVDVTVRAQEPRVAGLQGSKVLYFLHPTFGDQPRISYFTADGTAPLELYSYGAFTVGALLDDGTPLELNLATVPGAPAAFIAQ